MDIMRKLQSILAPSAGPVNRAPSAGGRPATSPAGQSFAEALQDASSEDPTIRTFGVLERLRRPVTGLDDGSGNPTGPTILPEIPAELILDLPVDTLDIEMRDTLESILVVTPDPVLPTKPEPSQPPVVREPKAVAVEPPTVAIPALPPIGVLWAPVAFSGGGVAAPGIAATGGQVAEMMQRKFDYYTEPARYGVSVIDEGRMFLDAVDRGYVPKTPEGLATLLSWNSMGDYDRDLKLTGRPPEISNYFKGWYRGTLPA